MPVRLLHTSDWHVGKRIVRQPRDEELVAALSEVRDLAEEERVDAVIVAGDIFDQHHPSAEAERIVLNALHDFYETGVAVLLIAGNHDSPKRWSAYSQFLALGNVHVLGLPAAHDDGACVVVEGHDGSEAEVVLLPWVPERALVGTAALMGRAGADYQSYAEGMREIIGAVCVESESGRPSVLVGHAFCQSAIVGDGEGALRTSDIYAVPGEVFPPHLSYVALGHVHRAQKVAAPVPVHYSGSLLQLDFSEQRQAKSVRVVDVAAGAPAASREVAITAGRPLLRATGTLEELEAMRGAIGDCWLSVELVCDQAERNLGDAVRRIFPDALEVRLKPRATTALAPRESLRSLNDVERFRRYVIDELGLEEPAEARMTLFSELMTDVAEQEVGV